MNSTLLDQKSLHDIASFIREVAKSGAYELWISNYAANRMYQRGIDRDDVPRILRSCRATNKEIRRGNWRYTVEGKTFDLKTASIVLEIEIEEEEEEERPEGVRFTVITVWIIEVGR